MQRWSKTLLPLLAAASLFAACRRPTYSSDGPLPTEYYPSVIINSDNQVVYAINPETGNKNWEVALPMPPSGAANTNIFNPSPLLYYGMVYVGTGVADANGAPNDILYKINSRTGKIVKKITIPGASGFLISATPVADANLIYVPFSNGTIYAIDSGSSALKWKFTALEPGASLQASPTVANGRVYIATTTGHVYSIDKTTGPDASGNPKWDWPGAGVISTATFFSSPAVDTHYLFVGSVIDSNMYCIYINPPTTGSVPEVGKKRWTYKATGAIYSSPTAYKGTCIFGANDFKLYCLDTFIYPNALPASMATTVPKARWVNNSARSEIYSSPIAMGNTVYFASKDYKLYCANILNGGIKWSFSSNGLIKSSPVPYRDKVYVASYDKTIYALDSGLGTVKWQFYVGGQMSCSPVIDDLTGKSYNSGISGLVN